MNNKHKQAFQELREWCKKWDMYINLHYIESGHGEYIYEPTQHLFDSGDDPFCHDTKEIIINDKVFNFMEKKDDNK